MHEKITPLTQRGPNRSTTTASGGGPVQEPTLSLLLECATALLDELTNCAGRLTGLVDHAIGAQLPTVDSSSKTNGPLQTPDPALPRAIRVLHVCHEKLVELQHMITVLEAALG